ncbi:hypothetical protein JMM81_10290 [Bacillus sp. V3B]|uniref:hypothetical protein n=1 Tax=Bacillus sp. V3B TaxID=2804915 RepID=UPI00210BCFB4|nr:hypothetical protein [Bacillus sp. V3B]MCQ6275351.1 hypothetical protein [Bacillus sp. V3B]
MKSGEIGLRAKKGFYSFEDKKIDEYQVETLRKFIDLLKHLEFMNEADPHSKVSESNKEENIVF